MKILLIYGKGTNELLDRKSALGSYIFCLCSLLIESGNEVMVNGISFCSLNKQTQKQVSIHSAIWKKFIPQFLKEVKRNKAIRTVHKSILQQCENMNRPDVILEFYTFSSSIGTILQKKWNSKLISVFDSPVLEEYEYFNGRKRMGRNKILNIQNESLKLSDRIVVYSNAVKNYVSNITGNHINIFVHQNVDFSRFKFFPIRNNSNPIRIGFIGSFLKWHRVDLLINAFDFIVSKGINAELYLIGNGVEFLSIKNSINFSSFKNKIHMTGFLDGEKLDEIKNSLEIGVMPGSNWYGAPNKIFEYGAAGLAVVAPNTPTIIDLFQGNEVLFFEGNNQTALNENLYLICQDENLRKQKKELLQKFINSNYSELNTKSFYSRLITF